MRIGLIIAVYVFLMGVFGTLFLGFVYLRDLDPRATHLGTVWGLGAFATGCSLGAIIAFLILRYVADIRL